MSRNTCLVMSVCWLLCALLTPLAACGEEPLEFGHDFRTTAAERARTAATLADALAEYASLYLSGVATAP